LRAGAVVREISRHHLEDRVRHCAATPAPGAASAMSSTLPGAFNVACVGDTLRFDHRGDMSELIGALAALPVVDFVREPGSLLDVFFEVYGTDSR
jgi:hypothetical protein